MEKVSVSQLSSFLPGDPLASQVVLQLVQDLDLLLGAHRCDRLEHGSWSGSVDLERRQDTLTEIDRDQRTVPGEARSKTCKRTRIRDE
jgi:hypothetical protein